MQKQEHILRDPKVPYPLFHVKNTRSKTHARRFIAEHALLYLRYMYEHKKARGAIIFDIDDTIIDYSQKVKGGFEHMKQLWSELHPLFTIYVITARPEDQREKVIDMLHKLHFCVDPDRLHLLPTEDYDKHFKYTERFKWKTFKKIEAEMKSRNQRVVARFGDRVWDVGSLQSLHKTKTTAGELEHIADNATVVFIDPCMHGCLSSKLPGKR